MYVEKLVKPWPPETWLEMHILMSRCFMLVGVFLVAISLTVCLTHVGLPTTWEQLGISRTPFEQFP